MHRILAPIQRILYRGIRRCHPIFRRSLGLTGPRRRSVVRAAIAQSRFAWCASFLLGIAALSIAVPSEAAPGALRDQARSADAADAAASAAQRPRWMPVPKVMGRLTARDIGLVINTADPYSVEVGAFYAAARRLAPEQILRVELPVTATLGRSDFDRLVQQIGTHFGKATQALALAWTRPYAVSCNSITGALALGYDAELCSRSCAPSRRSPYFNSASWRPFADHQLRPSMLLAARDAAMAKALISRGIKSDRSLGLRGAPPVHAYYVVTPDRARSVRAALFPPAGLLAAHGIDVHVETTPALSNVDHVLLYLTGLARVDKLDSVTWVPGALADHLTSYGGILDEGGGGQMSALEWIASGATASYGTVSEPCAHPQKFPHPQVLLLNYMQGSTALEAYWKSVAWPQQGVFVGEPLAAPFAHR
jgi:uncharacterized protein (TIGR03790 family)